VAVIVTALAVWAIHTLGVEILSVLQSTSAASSTGGITAAFDRGLLASIPAIAVAFLSTFAVLRAPRLYAWHPALLLPVVVALFWSQGHFEVSIFSHPSILAATMTVFILLEAALTILATIRRAGRRSAAGGAAAAAAADAGSAAAGGEGSDGSRLGRREYLPLVFLLLPLLLGVLMLLLGRYSEASTAQGGGLIRPTLFRFDFADYVNLESEISLSRDLVLLYREEAESSRQRLLLRSGGRLLRRFVLSGYDPRRGFFAETAPGREPEPTTVGEGSRSFPRRDYRSRSQLMQEYFLVNFDPSSLVSVNYPVEVVPFENWNESSFARIYEVTSSASDASSKQLLDAQVPRAPSLEGTEAGSADWYRYYTDYGGDEALAELAREITEGIEGDYARARAIERHFHEEYFYSLRPGVAADGNQLHHFLFNSRKGYCSYFAFSMTLMARSLELPARVAVGFFVDPRMSVMDYHAVRADMAHAWVEVYFENYGWIEFDPTATTIAPGEQYSMSLNMDMEQISALLEELLNHRDELERAGPAPPDTVSAGDGGPGLSGVLGFVRRTWLLLAAAAYLLIVAGYRFEPGLRAAAARDYRGRTRHRFLGLMRVLDSVGLRKSATETVYEYAARLELRRGVGAEVCAELYLKALFGEEFTDEDYRRFLAEERDLVRSLKTQVPRWRRMVGFLAPFLRFGSGAPEYETPAGGGAR
jgi:transglutaminase-like putative cysteine protease